MINGTFILQQEELSALLARIRFTRLFFQSLMALNKQNQPVSVAECTKLLSTCSEIIPVLLKSLDKGVQTTDSCKSTN